jgi:hypothetical protein
MMLTNKRVGMWSWALTGEEAVTALLVGRARQAGLPVAPDLARRHAAMMTKQQKLAARATRPKPVHVTVWRT